MTTEMILSKMEASLGGSTRNSKSVAGLIVVVYFLDVGNLESSPSDPYLNRCLAPHMLVYVMLGSRTLNLDSRRKHDVTSLTTGIFRG